MLHHHYIHFLVICMSFIPIHIIKKKKILSHRIHIGQLLCYKVNLEGEEVLLQIDLQLLIFPKAEGVGVLKASCNKWTAGVFVCTGRQNKHE